MGFGVEFDPPVEVLFRHCDNSNNATLTGASYAKDRKGGSRASVGLSTSHSASSRFFSPAFSALTYPSVYPPTFIRPCASSSCSSLALGLVRTCGPSASRQALYSVGSFFARLFVCHCILCRLYRGALKCLYYRTNGQRKSINSGIFAAEATQPLFQQCGCFVFFSV